jgi:two-component system NtrC family sensor kinase
MTTTAVEKLPILIIEDEPSVMSFVQAALERAGYEVMTANSGAEALPLLEENDFKGVVSDMRTPGGVDGADVHAWLAKNRPKLVSKLIFITGDIVNEETAKTLAKTGAPCVEKPFRIQQLMDVVKKVMGTPE